jgi:monoamine oxidase
VDELGLASFAQHDRGDFAFQRSRGEMPGRYPGQRQDPPSMRVAGGMGALVEALRRQLPASMMRLGHRVTGLELGDAGVAVACVDSAGAPGQLVAQQLILALPPRLLGACVAFRPALDEDAARRWRATPTWMAPHAKFFALYDTPFWRAAGLSGAAQSLVGPLVEIHDATSASGQAALFGFVGVAAAQRATVGREALIAAAVRQLQLLFGAPAGQPTATLLKDWAADPLTATADDQTAGGHPVPVAEPWVTGAWRDRLVLAGSETSEVAPGYLAGAVDAAERAVREVSQRLGLATATRAAGTTQES